MEKGGRATHSYKVGPSIKCLVSPKGDVIASMADPYRSKADTTASAVTSHSNRKQK